jgi:hypothetical protein
MSRLQEDQVGLTSVHGELRTDPASRVSPPLHHLSTYCLPDTVDPQLHVATSIMRAFTRILAHELHGLDPTRYTNAVASACSQRDRLIQGPITIDRSEYLQVHSDLSQSDCIHGCNFMPSSVVIESHSSKLHW